MNKLIYIIILYLCIGCNNNSIISYEETETVELSRSFPDSTDYEIVINKLDNKIDVILNILMYSGVVIRDPQIVQNAAQMVQQEEMNAKS